MKKTDSLLLLLLMLAGCSTEIPMLSLGIDDEYFIPRMSKLPLESALTGKEYVWTVNGDTVSTERRYIFLAAREGEYCLSFDIIDDATRLHFVFTVTVLHAEI